VFKVEILMSGLLNTCLLVAVNVCC